MAEAVVPVLPREVTWKSLRPAWRLRVMPKRINRSPALWVGAAIMGLVLLVALLAPMIAPYPMDQINPSARLLPPGRAHLLGTDALGRDLFSRVVWGARIAVQMAGWAVGLSATIGLMLGSLAGYYAGPMEQALSRLMDAWLSLPGALVAIVIVARLGPSLNHLILALGLMGVPAFYRLVRSTTLSARHAVYVQAAVAVGASDARIMWKHIFPNILSPLIVQITLRLGIVLLTGGSLSFIGLGAQPPLPEWGALLASGRSVMDSAWWLAVFPGLAMALTVVGLNLLGDGLRDALDPQLGYTGAKEKNA